MSRTEAPGGASSTGLHQPAIALNQTQGPVEDIDCSPVRIARMLRAVFDYEQKVRAWEDASKSKGRRLALVDGRLKKVRLSELAREPLQQARRERDKHLENLRHVIDYGLTTDAYKDVPCPQCRLPLDPMEFVKAVPSFNPPAILCKTCKGLGVVRKKKDGERAKKKFKRISYFNRVLNDTIDCAKVRMGTEGSDESYRRLEEANKALIFKFGNEKQTSLEAADAEQGVRQGLIDAARRFDPTRKEGAMFNTVAYNWCRRNSRARHDGEKRAGVYAPSIEAMGTDEEGNGAAALIADSDGALGSFSVGPSRDNSLTIDLREKVAELPLSQREVIQCELAGVSTVGTSKKLGISTAKVRKLRDLAFDALRNTMSGYVDVISD